jgi:hypothetical protein
MSAPGGLPSRRATEGALANGRVAGSARDHVVIQAGRDDPRDPSIDGVCARDVPSGSLVIQEMRAARPRRLRKE